MLKNAKKIRELNHDFLLVGKSNPKTELKLENFNLMSSWTKTVSFSTLFSWQNSTLNSARSFSYHLPQTHKKRLVHFPLFTTPACHKLAIFALAIIVVSINNNHPPLRIASINSQCALRDGDCLKSVYSTLWRRSATLQGIAKRSFWPSSASSTSSLFVVELFLCNNFPNWK